MKSNEFIMSHVEWLRSDHENCNPFLADAIEKLIADCHELENQNDSLLHSVDVLESRIENLIKRTPNV